MTTTAAAAPAVRASTSSLSVLAWYEARRSARNPVFLAAATLTAYILWDRQRGMVADINTVTVYPAIFLGGFGMVAAFWLTQSMRRSADALDVAPTPWPVRTAAICLAAVIPLSCGGLSLLAIGVFQQVPGDWSYGSLGTSNLFAVVLSQTVLPALAARCSVWPWPAGSGSPAPPPSSSWCSTAG